MTNSEIIRKISRHTGLYETDARLFFEIFTQKLFEEFKPGDILKLNNIGFIHLKNIGTGENEKFVKGILFSESKEAGKNSSIFFLSGGSEAFYPNDFSFSFGLNKMEIPMGENIDGSIFIPPSGNELLSFMDSKVDNLLSESEILRGSSKEDEKFLIPGKMPGIQVIENLEDFSEFHEVPEEENEREIDSQKFQKIDSLYSELKTEDEKIIGPEPPSFKDEEEEFDNGKRKEKDLRYKRVQFLSREKTKKAEEKKLEEKKLEEKDISEPSKISEEKTEVPAAGVIESIKEKKSETRKPEIQTIKEKRSRKRILLPLLFIIVIIGAAAYYFLMMTSSESTFIVEGGKVPHSNPVIINRNDNIPVSASGSGTNQDLLFNGISPAALSGEKNNNETSGNTDNEGEIPTIKKGTYKDYGDYIFYDGKTFFIQVSSWKSLKRAEAHSAELRGKGFKTSVERVISPGGDVYYRVKLGDFNSLAEARDFLQKK